MMAEDSKKYKTIAQIERDIDNINAAIMNRPTTSQVSDAIDIANSQVGSNPELVTDARIKAIETRLTIALQTLSGLTATITKTVKDILLDEITADDIADGLTKIIMLLAEREKIVELDEAVTLLVATMNPTLVRVALLEAEDIAIYEEIDRLDVKDSSHDNDISDLEIEQGIQRGEIDSVKLEQIVQNNDIDVLETQTGNSDSHVADITTNPHEISHISVGLSNVTNDAQLKVAQLGVANGVAPLGADGKVPVTYLPQFLQFRGFWNADTNTPSLVSGVGTEGDLYIVNVPGNTSLDGITDWKTKDWCAFANGVWNQVDNTENVVSVDGQTGIVDLSSVYHTQSSFISSTSGIPDASKPILTDLGGKIDIGFISQALINHNDISNSGSVSHDDLDVFINNLITSSTGPADSAKGIKTNSNGILDHSILESPLLSYNLGVSFTPTITKGIISLKSTVNNAFTMTSIIVSDTAYDGQRIKVRLTQGLVGGDISSWSSSFIGSNLISLNSIGLSIGVGVTDILTFEYDGDRSKWILVGFLDKIDA